MNIKALKDSYGLQNLQGLDLVCKRDVHLQLKDFQIKVIVHELKQIMQRVFSFATCCCCNIYMTRVACPELLFKTYEKWLFLNGHISVWMWVE
jgi:hypothetical protein